MSRGSFLGLTPAETPHPRPLTPRQQAAVYPAARVGPWRGAHEAEEEEKKKKRGQRPARQLASAQLSSGFFSTAMIDSVSRGLPGHVRTLARLLS